MSGIDCEWWAVGNELKRETFVPEVLVLDDRDDARTVLKHAPRRPLYPA